MTLTIAIPTFNRKREIEGLLTKLSSQHQDFEFKYLIIDDGSTDGTFECLESLNLDPEVFTILSRENRGYARTFLELLTRAETEWVLLTSDDDEIDLQSIVQIENQMMAPEISIIVTNWEFSDGRILRGNRGSALLQAPDTDQAMHAPGIIYRPSGLVPAMRALESALDSDSEAAFFYPQIILTAHAVASRSAIFSPLTPVKELAGLPSNLVNSDGINYWHPLSRIGQYLAFVPLFEDLGNMNYIDSGLVSRELLKRNRRKFLEVAEFVFAPKGALQVFRAEAVTLYSKRFLVAYFRFREIRLFLRKSSILLRIYRFLSQR